MCQAILDRFDISPSDLRALKECGETLGEAAIERVVEQFYEWLPQQPEFNVFFNRKELLEQVKNQQKLYWIDFFKGIVDQRYIDYRIHIGRVHARRELPGEIYFAGMLHFQLLFLAEIRALGLSPERLLATTVAYTKLAAMDTFVVSDQIAQVSRTRMELAEELNANSQALRASEQLFRSIFENSQIGISFFNITGHAIFTNRAFQQMLGYSESELSLLETWDGIIHPDERVSGRERYAELVQGKREKDEWEQRFVRRDGRVVIANARFLLIRDSSGKPQYVASLTEDITEKKHAEEKLKRSEELFRSVYENAQIGIGIFNVKTGEHLLNRAQIKMLGYSQEELSHTEQWDKIVHPEERASGAKRYGDLVQGLRDTDEYTQRFICRDGQISTESGRFTLIRDSAGRPQYVIALHEDVTERLRASEALAASERLFRSIFENAQIGIGVFKIETEAHLSNRALHEMLGYSGTELDRLQQWDDIVPEDERDLYAQRYRDLVLGRKDKDEYEQHFIRRDGRVFLTRSRFQLLRDSAGKPQCVVALTEDITERRRAEEDREQAMQLFRSVFENAQIGIGIYDIQTREHISNESMHRILGYSQ